MIPVFDGHNDVLLRLIRGGGSPVARFLDGEEAGHIDLPRAKAGGFAGGLFAVFVPSADVGTDREEMMRAASYDVPLPSEVALTNAQGYALGMVALLLKIVRQSDGRVRLCRSAGDIRASLEQGSLATVMHIEGAEPIDPDFRMLEVLRSAGLRSLGLVWSRPNIFGHGVPFRFPSSPDAGPGLTDIGKALLRACNELKILVDVSHLSEQGFWDVVALSEAPVVATHSNAHALCPHSRNLTDRQLAAIRDSGGMVGINFATCFLRADGRMLADTPFDDVVRHADYLIAALGEDHVGLGSDFDGGTIPEVMGDVAGLPKLVDAFHTAGYDDALLQKLCCDNWLTILGRTWGA
jgi:membrane dipeptidase